MGSHQCDVADVAVVRLLEGFGPLKQCLLCVASVGERSQRARSTARSAHDLAAEPSTATIVTHAPTTHLGCRDSFAGAIITGYVAESPRMRA